MTNANDNSAPVSPSEPEAAQNESLPRKREPSNEVHARVGDVILRAARDGVRRGVRPEDIIREIVTEHNVRLNVGELRLLLAARPIPKPGTSTSIEARDRAG